MLGKTGALLTKGSFQSLNAQPLAGHFLTVPTLPSLDFCLIGKGPHLSPRGSWTFSGFSVQGAELFRDGVFPCICWLLEGNVSMLERRLRGIVSYRPHSVHPEQPVWPLPLLDVQGKVEDVIIWSHFQRLCPLTQWPAFREGAHFPISKHRPHFCPFDRPYYVCHLHLHFVYWEVSPTHSVLPGNLKFS